MVDWRSDLIKNDLQRVQVCYLSNKSTKGEELLTKDIDIETHLL